MKHLFLPLALAVTLTATLVWADPVLVGVSPEGLDDHEKWLAFETSRGYLGAGSWRYHPGDDLSWAEPTFDDSEWEIVDPGLPSGYLPQSGWDGIGWFRLHLDVNPALAGKNVALLIRQVGATEVYLENRLVGSLGTVSATPGGESPRVTENATPLPIRFERGGHYVLTIRHSCHERPFAGSRFAGFRPFLISWDRAVSRRESFIRSRTAYQAFFCGVPIAMMLVHLLLFAFYPKSRLNLYFATFAGSAALVTYCAFQLRFTSDPGKYATAMVLFRVSLLVVVSSGLRILYGVLYTGMPRRFWVLMAAALVLALTSSILNEEIYDLFAILMVVEMLRVTVIAMVKRMEGAWIIGLGLAVFCLSILLQMAVAFQFVASEATALNFVYVYGVLGFLIAMSVYLARDFARVNRNLETANVELEQYSHGLEQKVGERTRELHSKNAELEGALKDLKRTQGELVQSEKMASLAKLVAGVAHELRTPTGVIKSSHQTLARAVGRLGHRGEQGSADADARKIFDAIEKASQVLDEGVNRVNSVVNSLEGFARLDRAEYQTADLHDGIESTLVLLQPTINDRIRVERDYGEIPSVYCAPAQINQVFMHVIRNAAESIDGPGEIRIRTFENDRMVCVEISDTGSGMDDEQVRHAFDFDFKSSSARVRLGFSLPTAYNIVRDHDGSIEIASRLGEGTTVTISLPVDRRGD